MSLIVRMRRQTAVYWAAPVSDGRGRSTYDAPVELAPPAGVRWEDITELFIDNEGEEQQSRAVVYVGIDVDIGGYLYLGAESTLESDHSDPEVIATAYKIRQYGKLPNIRNTEILRQAWL